MKKSILIIMMVIISIFTFSATLRVNVVPPTLKNVNGDLLFVTDFKTAGIGAGAAGGYFKAGAWISPFKLFLGFEF